MPQYKFNTKLNKKSDIYITIENSTIDELDNERAEISWYAEVNYNSNGLKIDLVIESIKLNYTEVIYGDINEDDKTTEKELVINSTDQDWTIIPDTSAFITDNIWPMDVDVDLHNKKVSIRF